MEESKFDPVQHGLNEQIYSHGLKGLLNHPISDRGISDHPAQFSKIRRNQFVKNPTDCTQKVKKIRLIPSKSQTEVALGRDFSSLFQNPEDVFAEKVRQW